MSGLYSFLQCIIVLPTCSMKNQCNAQPTLKRDVRFRSFFRCFRDIRDGCAMVYVCGVSYLSFSIRVCDIYATPPIAIFVWLRGTLSCSLFWSNFSCVLVQSLRD